MNSPDGTKMNFIPREFSINLGDSAAALTLPIEIASKARIDTVACFHILEALLHKSDLKTQRIL